MIKNYTFCFLFPEPLKLILDEGYGYESAKSSPSPPGLRIDPPLLEAYSAERLRPPNQAVFALITKRPNLPLAIHNYTNRAFMKQTAPDELALVARILVTETTTGTVVSRSSPNKPLLVQRNLDDDKPFQF